MRTVEHPTSRRAQSLIQVCYFNPSWELVYIKFSSAQLITAARYLAKQIQDQQTPTSNNIPLMYDDVPQPNS